jgi:uncharacterized protein (UPF0248 family)
MKLHSLLAAAVCVAASQSALALGSLADVSIHDRQANRVLPVYQGYDGAYLAGTPGNEYSIRIRNRSDEEVLAVISVDGVNVVTGQTANPQQSGYVIPAHGVIEVKGWRKSLERIAAFYFTDLGDSYAARTGRLEDVGVIGVALFKRKPEPRLTLEQQRDWRDQPAGPAADPASGSARKDESAKRASPAPSPAPSLGTGHGRGESSHARYVGFERESSSPNEVVTLRYDSRENLVAMGVIPEKRRRPDPFPGSFVPDPS